jgi:hypothetical protein
MYKAELRDTIESLLDKTKVDVEEARLKIKEIVDYEGHSLQWLIKSIRSMRMTYGLAGGDNMQYSVKVHDSFDKETPKPPAHLTSKYAPIRAAGVRMIDLLPPGSAEVLKNSDYYVSLFITNSPASQWKKLGFVPTQDIDVQYTHPTLGRVQWRHCLDLTQSPPVYRFFFIPATTWGPPAGSDWHIRASNPAAAAAIKK